MWKPRCLLFPVHVGENHVHEALLLLQHMQPPMDRLLEALENHLKMKNSTHVLLYRVDIMLLFFGIKLWKTQKFSCFYFCRMSDMELESLEGDAEENIDELETVVKLFRCNFVLWIIVSPFQKAWIWWMSLFSWFILFTHNFCNQKKDIDAELENELMGSTKEVEDRRKSESSATSGGKWRKIGPDTSPSRDRTYSQKSDLVIFSQFFHNFSTIFLIIFKIHTYFFISVWRYLIFLMIQ